MIGPTSRQGNLFYTPLARQAELLKDDLLEPIDEILDNPDLVDLVRDLLQKRSPKAARTGRTSIAPDRLLRCFVLKHIKGWSFRQLEHELRANIVYRRFTRYDDDKTPNYTTFSRNFALLGPDETQAIHQHIVAQAKVKGAIRAEKLRSDTTVVETNIHHPSDSGLLADGVRVLTRAMKYIAAECKEGALVVSDHARAVKHRLLEISRAAKAKTETNRARLQSSYRKLLAITRKVVRQAQTVVAESEARALAIAGSGSRVFLYQSELNHYLPLVQKVIAQTKARVFDGNKNFPGKVLSLFEPHSEVIRKGKPHKPTEFGRLVRLDEVESGIVSQYQVLEGNRCDTTATPVALQNHVDQFGRPPRLFTADRGYFSAENEKKAEKMGVDRVSIPARGRLSETRKKLQRQRWYKRAQRWRAGAEARIGTLKNNFAMARATYKGSHGFVRYVAGCVIANNLVSLARCLRQRDHGQENR